MNTTASRRFYQLLDEGRAHLKVLAVQHEQVWDDERDAKATEAAMEGLLKAFNELHTLLPKVKEELHERIYKRATATYCRALGLPYSPEARRQLEQESAAFAGFTGDKASGEVHQNTCALLGFREQAAREVNQVMGMPMTIRCTEHNWNCSNPPEMRCLKCGVEFLDTAVGQERLAQLEKNPVGEVPGADDYEVDNGEVQTC